MLNLVKLRQNSAIKFLSVTSKALRYLEGVLPVGKINDCGMNSLAIPKVSVLFFFSVLYESCFCYFFLIPYSYFCLIHNT